jgi:hypothetical protein
MFFEAFHGAPAAASIAADLEHDVAAFVNVRRGAAASAVPRLRDGIAEQTTPAAFDALRAAQTQFGAGTQLASAERLANALLQGLERLPLATQAELTSAGVAAAFERLPNPVTPVATAEPQIAAQVAAFVAAAATAQTPAETSAAGALFAALASTVSAPALVTVVETLLAGQAQPEANLAAGWPGTPLPQATPRTSAANAPPVPDGPDRRRDRLDEQLPDTDPDGRPYTAAERVRLARLILDPRRGTAPEAHVAIAAWRAFGLDLYCDPSGVADFVDADGEPWDIVFDADPARRAALLAARPDVNAIVGGPATLALVLERRSAPYSWRA